jgi:hypothetical protein
MFFTKRNKKLAENVDNLENLVREIRELNRKNEISLNLISQKEKAITTIIKEAELGKTNYLQTLISEYYELRETSLVNDFRKKKHPIHLSTANELKKIIANELRTLRARNKELEYFSKFAIEAFPELEQFSPFELLVEEKEIDDTYHSISEKEYYKLSKEEYLKLEPTERNQLKLDMWWTRRKSNTTLGRDYERFVGYIYEKTGYGVYYQGVEKGKQDLGIDLICENNKEIFLLQCKYWKQGGMPIRENAINQLYGTGIKYQLDRKHRYGIFYREKPIIMKLITSNVLSDTAREFANALGVKYSENCPLKRYPIIKCNVSSSGVRIYHLPFDQQYDNTKIKNAGEFYAMTVKEAEDAGFRRAYRWRG